MPDDLTHRGTTPTDVDTSISQVWARNVMRSQLRGGFWSRFTGGEASGAAIIQKTELLNNPGDTIHINITAPLVGAGVSGDLAVLQGNEETLSTSSIKVIPTLKRHAVRINRRSNKKSVIGLREEAKMRLAEWGMAKLDTDRFTAFAQITSMNGETYTANTRVVGGGTTVDDIVAADTITVASLQIAKLDLYNNLAKPIMVDGEELFVAVVHPNALYDLKRESEYRDWVREAHVRGADNPFFKGATAMVDGILLFQHSRVPTLTNANAAPAKTAKNIIFGAEAFLEGLDESVSWYEEEFDYGIEWGVAYSYAYQCRRGLEANSLQFYSAAVDK